MAEGQKISGRDIEIALGDLALIISSITLGIEDTIEIAKDKGIPNGWVSGAVSAEGEADLDSTALSVLTESARAAGSWRDLPLFDALFYAKTSGGEEFKVEAFGCKLLISDLINKNDNEGGGKHTVKVKYLVTSPDFVRINGVPYLNQNEIASLIAA